MKSVIIKEKAGKAGMPAFSIAPAVFVYNTSMSRLMLQAKISHGDLLASLFNNSSNENLIVTKLPQRIGCIEMVAPRNVWRGQGNYTSLADAFPQ